MQIFRRFTIAHCTFRIASGNVDEIVKVRASSHLTACVCSNSGKGTFSIRIVQFVVSLCRSFYSNHEKSSLCFIMDSKVRWKCIFFDRSINFAHKKTQVIKVSYNYCDDSPNSNLKHYTSIFSNITSVYIPFYLSNSYLEVGPGLLAPKLSLYEFSSHLPSTESTSTLPVPHSIPTWYPFIYSRTIDCATPSSFFHHFRVLFR